MSKEGRNTAQSLVRLIIHHTPAFDISTPFDFHVRCVYARKILLFDFAKLELQWAMIENCIGTHKPVQRRVKKKDSLESKPHGFHDY
jgi:hypothetical protein